MSADLWKRIIGALTAYGVELIDGGVRWAAAITGQSMQMVQHYAKQVNQKKLAASAIPSGRTPNEPNLYNGRFDLVQRRPAIGAKSLKGLVGDVGFEPTTR